MAQTTPPTITAAPTAPQRGVKATFSAAVDAFVTWLVAAVSQFGAVATNVYNNAVDAFNSATAAAASATSALGYSNTASGFADAAAASVGAPVWVSGATYAQNARVFSPAAGRIYFRKTASGSGTTDPSADTTNWGIVLTGANPYLHVREEQPSGTSAGASVSGNTVVRVLNTVKVNTISGASLASNQVTLPAGTYEVFVRAPAWNAGNKAWLNTASGPLLVGSSTIFESFITGQIVLASTQVVWISHYVNSNSAQGLGQSQTTGNVEVYTEAIFRKVA